MSERERMGPYLSVFNGHVNNAHERALRRMRREKPGSSKIVTSIARKGGGIMAIFAEKPNPATRRYVALVEAYVNEGLPT